MDSTSHVAKGFTPPKKTIIAYKQFRTLKNSPGNIFPLFIGKSTPTPIGVWIEAKFFPTKGFANRPGWHAGILPCAPHLRSKKINSIAIDRVWAEVEIPADVNWQKIADATKTGNIRDKVPQGGFYRFRTSKLQGGAWIIGGALKVNKILTNAEVKKILIGAGLAEDAEAEQNKNLEVFKPFFGHKAVEMSPEGNLIQSEGDALSETLLEEGSFFDTSDMSGFDEVEADESPEEDEDYLKTGF